MNRPGEQRTLHRPARACAVLKNREIRQVITQGKSFVNQYFVVYILPNEKSSSKVGFCTGRAAGHAVKRNRIRRRTKEIFRLVAKDLADGYSVVIIARPEVYAAEFQQLQRAMENLFLRGGVITPGRKVEAECTERSGPEAGGPKNAHTQHLAGIKKKK
ncbi:MAG TPA: ribonuclease P protein component [Firmicutes bacterium]|nr:ribonuclease P protein component [Bacillota bacterium]